MTGIRQVAEMLVGTAERFSHKRSFQTWVLVSKETCDCHERLVVDCKTHDNGEHLSRQLGQHFKDGVLLFRVSLASMSQATASTISRTR